MLNTLQAELAKLYEIQTTHNIDDFLITSLAQARTVAGRPINTFSKEQLLIQQDIEQLNIALFLDNSVLEKLQQHNPPAVINQHYIQAYWLALEGVSHFLYLTWRASHDRPATQLELELQAEIDKFICTNRLLRQYQHNDSVHNLHSLLFEQTKIHQQLSGQETQRYQTANRYAAKYCLSLQQKLGKDGFSQPFMNELRRFYRFSQNEKIRHIDKPH